MSAQFRPVWLVTDPISGARGVLGFLVEDDGEVAFLPAPSTTWATPENEALAKLLTGLLQSGTTFNEPAIGLGPQVVFGEVAAVPRSAQGGCEWVASTILTQAA